MVSILSRWLPCLLLCLLAAPFLPGDVLAHTGAGTTAMTSPGTRSSPPPSDTLLSFAEDFEGEGWPGERGWMGTLSHFRIDSGGIGASGRASLRLDAPTAGYSILYNRQEGITGDWRFSIRQGFSPSTSNRAWFFPMCDAPPDDPSLNGYAVRLGEAGADKRIRLYRFDSGESRLLTTAPLQLTEGAYDVRVSRDADHAWRLEVRPSGQEQWVLSPVKVDSTHLHSLFSGFYFQYTSTRRDLTWLDDLAAGTRPGRFFALEALAVNQNRLQVGFSHSIMPMAWDGEAAGVHLLTDGSDVLRPEKVDVENATLTLGFEAGVPDGVHRLELGAIESRYGGPPEPRALALEVRNPFRIRSASIPEPNRVRLDFHSPFESVRSLMDGLTLLPGFSTAGDVPLVAGRSDPAVVRPVSADSIGPALVELLFPADLPHGTHWLRFSGLADPAGWVLADTMRRIHRYHAPLAGDVLISEILFDTDRSPEQWVELVAATGKHLDLSGWQLIRKGRGLDRARPLSTRELPLPAGERLVLARETSWLEGVAPQGSLHAMADFPGLNRSTADRILLLSPDGEVSDSVAFDPGEWHVDGRSLERRSAGLPGWVAENWAVSIHPDGFTPGSPNRPDRDLLPPDLLEARFVSAEEAVLRFSERLGHPDHPGTLHPPEVRVQSDHPLEGWVAREDSLRLLFSTPTESDQLVTIRHANVADLFGNALPDGVLRLRRHAFDDSGEAPRVVLNEFRSGAHAGGTAEFVELRNLSRSAVDLSGWALRVQGTHAPLGAGAVIRPENQLVLSRSPRPPDGGEGDGGAPWSTDGRWIRWEGLPALADRGFTMELVSPDGVIIDSLAFDARLWGEQDSVRNHQRRDPLAPGDDPSNWVLSPDSPMLPNPEARADTAAPLLIDLARSVGDPERVEFVFDEFIGRSTGLEVVATGGDGVEVVLRGGQLSIERNRIAFTDPFFGLEGPEEAIFLARSVTDRRGNLSMQAGGSASRAPAPGEVVINEVLFDPMADPMDGLPDQPELIEIWNTGNARLRLESPAFHFGPDEQGRISPYGLTCDACHPLARWPVLEPGEFAVIHPEPEGEPIDSTRIRRFFGLVDPTSETVAGGVGSGFAPDRSRDGRWVERERYAALRLPAKTLSLKAAGGSIVLIDAHRRLDSVSYSQAFHNGFLADFKGRSLERIRGDLPALESDNWGTSADPLGATPWRRNSMAMPPAQGPVESVTIAPNPFTPDDDGSNDVTQIHYALPAAGHILLVEVFDVRGRRIRTLREGQPAGTEGAVIWDGRDRSGRPIPRGLYIVRFEAFNMQGGRRVLVKHPVIVAGVPP